MTPESTANHVDGFGNREARLPLLACVDGARLVVLNIMVRCVIDGNVISWCYIIEGKEGKLCRQASASQRVLIHLLDDSTHTRITHNQSPQFRR